MNFLLIQNISSIFADMCGMAVLPPGWSHQERNMDTTVLILGDQGKLIMQEEDTLLEIIPSTITLLSAGRSHVGIEPTSEKTCYHWLHFCTDNPPTTIPEKEALQILQSPEIAKRRLANSLLLPSHITLDHYSHFKDLFQEVLNEYQTKSFTEHKYQTLAKLLLISLNELIIHMYSKKEDNLRSGLVSAMIKNIYENLADHDYSVKKMAYSLGYNPEYLNRHFKSIMDISLKSFILDKKIELAIRYLRETSLSLGEIAEKSGFASYRNFVRQFKSRTDQLPSDFRARFLLMNINH